MSRQWQQRAIYVLGTIKKFNHIKIVARKFRPNKKTKGWIYIIQVKSTGDLAVISEHMLTQYLQGQHLLEEIAFENLLFPSQQPESSNYKVGNTYQRVIAPRVSEIIGVSASVLEPNFKTNQVIYIIIHMGHIALISEQNFNRFLSGESFLPILAFEKLHFTDTHCPFLNPNRFK